MKVEMHPIDFEEFCWIFDASLLCDYIKTCFTTLVPLDKYSHSRALYLFKLYMLLGGMPQSISSYLNNNRTFVYSDIIKKEIINLYRNDINKINTFYKSKILGAFDQIPGALSKHEKSIVFSKIPGGIKTQESYENTFFWLGDSKIVNECFKCDDPVYGLSISENRVAIKCYLLDTGLLFSMLFLNEKEVRMDVYNLIMNNKFSFNKGILYENLIAQELRTNFNKLYFYTKFNPKTHKNEIEVDFIIEDVINKKIIPIEVKSSKNYKTESLRLFNSKFKNRISKSFIIHPKNLSITEDGIIHIPSYMTFCINLHQTEK